MTAPAWFAKVVEVFPMRLGGEVLVDVTLEPEDDDFPAPKPDDRLVVPSPEGEIDLPIWAAPSIPQVRGARRLNVQFPRAAPGVNALAEGQRVEFRPK